VTPFKDEADALRLANDSFSRPDPHPPSAARIGRRPVKAGIVWINDHHRSIRRRPGAASMIPVWTRMRHRKF